MILPARMPIRSSLSYECPDHFWTGYSNLDPIVSRNWYPHCGHCMSCNYSNLVIPNTDRWTFILLARMPIELYVAGFILEARQLEPTPLCSPNAPLQQVDQYMTTQVDQYMTTASKSNTSQIIYCCSVVSKSCLGKFPFIIV